MISEGGLLFFQTFWVDALGCDRNKKQQSRIEMFSDIIGASHMIMIIVLSFTFPSLFC